MIEKNKSNPLQDLHQTMLTNVGFKYISMTVLHSLQLLYSFYGGKTGFCIYSSPSHIYFCPQHLTSWLGSTKHNLDWLTMQNAMPILTNGPHLLIFACVLLVIQWNSWRNSDMISKGSPCSDIVWANNCSKSSNPNYLGVYLELNSDTCF